MNALAVTQLPSVDRKFVILLVASLLLHAAALALGSGLHRAMPPEMPSFPLVLRLNAAESTGASGANSGAIAATRPVAGQAANPFANQAANQAIKPERAGALQATPVAAPAVLPKVRQGESRRQSSAAVRTPPPAGPANTPANAVEPRSAETGNAAGQELGRDAPAALAATEAIGATAAARPAGDALESYRRQLAALFAGQRAYPRIAALRGWEGEVRLRLKIARKGNLLGVALDRSSGYEVLDQHALSLLESHGDLPPLPDALEFSEIQVIVPIHYTLRKTT